MSKPLPSAPDLRTLNAHAANVRYGGEMLWQAANYVVEAVNNANDAAAQNAHDAAKPWRQHADRLLAKCLEQADGGLVVAADALRTLERSGRFDLDLGNLLFAVRDSADRLGYPSAGAVCTQIEDGEPRYDPKRYW